MRQTIAQKLINKDIKYSAKKAQEIPKRMIWEIFQSHTKGQIQTKAQRSQSNKKEIKIWL